MSAPHPAPHDTPQDPPGSPTDLDDAARKACAAISSDAREDDRS